MFVHCISDVGKVIHCPAAVQKASRRTRDKRKHEQKCAPGDPFAPNLSRMGASALHTLSLPHGICCSSDNWLPTLVSWHLAPRPCNIRHRLGVRRFKGLIKPSNRVRTPFRMSRSEGSLMRARKPTLPSTLSMKAEAVPHDWPQKAVLGDFQSIQNRRTTGFTAATHCQGNPFPRRYSHGNLLSVCFVSSVLL